MTCEHDLHFVYLGVWKDNIVPKLSWRNFWSRSPEERIPIWYCGKCKKQFEVPVGKELEPT